MRLKTFTLLLHPNNQKQNFKLKETCLNSTILVFENKSQTLENMLLQVVLAVYQTVERAPEERCLKYLKTENLEAQGSFLSQSMFSISIVILPVSRALEMWPVVSLPFLRKGH